jgi:hypothetical protein
MQPHKAALSLSMAVLLGCVGVFSPSWSPIGIVEAAEGGHSGGGHGGGRQGGGGHGGHGSLPSSHSGGHDSGATDEGHDHEDGDDEGHGGKQGKGNNQTDSSYGHQSARGGDRSVATKVFGGGRPVWAREGIPQVELGRLNVSRAPGHVLERAGFEALSGYTPAMAALYNLNAEAAAARLQADFTKTARIDSPLQNLALYKEVMIFGRSELPGVENNQMDLAAILLASAADKTIPITEDTVVAVNRILGLVDVGDQERATLATKAEMVRTAILTGHGDESH